MSAEGYEIALARPQDVPLLPEIERKASDLFMQVPLTAAMPLCMKALADSEAAQREGTLWVARGGDGAPVGFALVERVGDEFHLEEIDVLPEHGRRGLGAALVREVCGWAERQAASVTLCTFRAIPWNAPFYERLGFKALLSGELTPALQGRILEETARGLSPEHRVAMRWIGNRAR